MERPAPNKNDGCSLISYNVLPNTLYIIIIERVENEAVTSTDGNWKQIMLFTTNGKEK